MGNYRFISVILFVSVYLCALINFAEVGKVLIGVKQKSILAPNNCIFEYNVDLDSTPAPCSNYISMMMDNYNLDESSVPIAPAYRNSSLPLSKVKSLSMQQYVSEGGDQPTCNYTLQKVEDEEDCCTGYENYPNCNISVCYTDQGGCYNGGRCNSPNLCTCPPNYTGIQCDEDIPSIIESYHPSQLYCYQSDQCFAYKKYNFVGRAVSFDECCSDKSGSWGSQSGRCVSCNATFSTSLDNRDDQSFSTCHSYGMDFYRTFDGQLFTFQGRCTYLLSTPSKVASSPWSVSIAFENCDTTKCKKRVIVDIGETVIKSEDGGLSFATNKNNNFTYISISNSENALTVPGTSMFAHRQDDFVILSLEVGNIKVKWDSRNNVYIIAQNSVLDGNVKGLCGNGDNNPRNDFFDADNVASFGNSFKADGCPDFVNEVAECDPSDQILANQQCNKIRLKFPQCTGLENSDPYFAMCVQSVCTKSKVIQAPLNVSDVSQILCTHLAAYSETCTEKGSCIQWRSDTLCENTCPSNKIWSDCASECPITCRNLYQVPSTYCKNSKVGRCICAPGEVEDNNTCIAPNDCPCLYDGKEHPPGTVRKFDCNTCKSARWQCTNIICPSVCTIMGTQYETFDGSRYSFNGVGCKYVLMQPLPETTDDSTNIRVEIHTNTENLINNGDYSSYISLPKIIVVSYNGSNIQLKATSPGLGDSPTNVLQLVLILKIHHVVFTIILKMNDDKERLMSLVEQFLTITAS